MKQLYFLCLFSLLLNTQLFAQGGCEPPYPDCDDEDCNTYDEFDIDICECVYTLFEPLNCDDNDCLTEDSYNTVTCECDNFSIPMPDCDDDDCNTDDVFDLVICECVHTQIPPSDCDDYDCTTENTYNYLICECEYIPIPPPDCDDEDCITQDLFDPVTCDCINMPMAPPDCNDDDCSTLDSYDPDICECYNEPVVCDDDNCETIDSFNMDNCECDHILGEPMSIMATYNCITGFTYQIEGNSSDYEVSIPYGMQLEDGDYTITVTDDDGCTVEETFTVNCEEVAIEQAHKGAIKVYPNPSDTYCQINSNDLVEVKIYNNLGQLVNQYKKINNQKIDVSDYKSGLYWLQFYKQDQIIQSTKLIVL